MSWSHTPQDKRTRLWENIWACFVVGLCLVLLTLTLVIPTSAAQTSEVAVNYHNCLCWLLAIHLRLYANKFTYELFQSSAFVPLEIRFLTVISGYTKAMKTREVYKSVYAAPCLPFMASLPFLFWSKTRNLFLWVQNVIPMSPFIKNIYYIFMALAVTAWSAAVSLQYKNNNLQSDTTHSATFFN